ncbi:hypothetical protein [Clostridium sp. B9]|uniref:hypothetical protein n=1 Tax=Clostridium sp. B9 TaxID=3423224 RepID=UPI003D2ECC03
MLIGLLQGVFIAWFLSVFDFDEVFIKGFNEIFDKKITKDTYYLIFAFLGVLSGVF